MAHLDTSVPQRYPDLLEHYNSARNATDISKQGLEELRQKREYLCLLVEARDSMNEVRSNSKAFEDDPIAAFPLLLRAFELREAAANIAKKHDSRNMIYWFVDVLAPRDRLEKHLLQSIALMKPENRRAKREYALKKCAGDDNADSDVGGDIGCFGAFTPRNQRPFTLDNDHIRLYMVKTMDCKDCTKLRSEDIARTMDAEGLGYRYALSFRDIIDAVGSDFDLGRVFCIPCHDRVVADMDLTEDE